MRRPEPCHLTTAAAADRWQDGRCGDLSDAPAYRSRFAAATWPPSPWIVARARKAPAFPERAGRRGLSLERPTLALPPLRHPLPLLLLSPGRRLRARAGERRQQVVLATRVSFPMTA